MDTANISKCRNCLRVVELWQKGKAGGKMMGSGGRIVLFTEGFATAGVVALLLIYLGNFLRVKGAEGPLYR